MPLQNRVTPRGDLIATEARGTMMGNRGVLHDENRRIVRRANSRLWIVCLLDFKDRQQTVMRPGRYTQLFFLDEAVALAAGHRPCGECRWPAYRAYLAGVNADAEAPDAPALNQLLHLSRNAVRGVATVATLPDGAFVDVEGDLLLKWHGALHLWTPAGYSAARPVESVRRATVVTPDLSLGALRQGYPVAVHPSAG